MQTYSTWVDPRVNKERAKMRAQTPSDLAGATMRLALHMSEEEHAYLEAKNPDSLGLPPGIDHDTAWRKFIEHPASIPYRVNKV